MLERQLGTQLVRRTQEGVHATEAGRILVDHADAVLSRLALAEAQIADLAGLRAGHVRLGSFFTALVYLSAELGGLLESHHPDLFSGQSDVIQDELVDRPTAFRGGARTDRRRGPEGRPGTSHPGRDHARSAGSGRPRGGRHAGRDRHGKAPRFARRRYAGITPRGAAAKADRQPRRLSRGRSYAHRPMRHVRPGRIVKRRWTTDRTARFGR